MIYDDVGGVERATFGHNVYECKDLERSDDRCDQHEEGRGPEHRECDVPEAPPGPGPVDHRGLVELVRYRLQAGEEDHHLEADVDPDGHDDQGEQRGGRAVEPGEGSQPHQPQRPVEKPEVGVVHPLPDDGDGDEARDVGQEEHGA